MNETVNCPSCDRPLRVPEELLGRQVKCPACSNAFTAELRAPAPPRAAERREDRDDREDDRPRGKVARRARDEDEDEDEAPARGRRRRSGRYLAPHRGGMVLTMGILALFIFPIVFGPIAWVMGNTDLREMRAGRMDPEGESQTNTGRVLGMVGTILGIVGILFGCLFFVFMFAVIGAAAPGPGPAPRRKF